MSLRHAAAARGLPVVVMAGHSACLSPDGPVHSSLPIGVFTGRAVQPNWRSWSLVMMYRLKPLYLPEPTTKAGPNAVLRVVITVPDAVAGRWAAPAAALAVLAVTSGTPATTASDAIANDLDENLMRMSPSVRELERLTGPGCSPRLPPHMSPVVSTGRAGARPGSLRR